MADNKELMIDNQEELLALPGFSYENRQAEVVELSIEDHDTIVNRICKDFDRWDRAKSKARRRWKNTQRIVKGVVSEIETDRSNALVPYGKQSHQTLISHFWGRSLQSDNVLFSVYGKDEDSKNTAPTMKEHLLEILRADRFQQKLDDGVDDALMKGIVLAHVGYCEAKHTIQVLSGYKGTEQEYDEDGNRAYTQTEQTEQDSATLTIIDPEEFVFDTTNHEDWDACFKVYRSWKVLEDIEAEPTFSNFDGLEELEGERSSGYDRYFPKRGKREKQNKPIGIDDEGRIELLEFHGNIRLPDKTYLRNWTIVIAGRSKIVKFERNPYFVNPFIKWQYERAPDGWGYSPMDYIVGIVDAASCLLNTGVEAGKLAINPPMIAPKGMLPQKRFYMREGMVIEYTPDPGGVAHLPVPVPIKYDTPFPFLQLFEGQCESTTGATRQLSGNVTTNDKAQTATEFQGLQVVGNLILDRIVGRFNLFFKVPAIQKMALITAMFNPEPQDDTGNPMQVEVQNEKGVRELTPVTPDVMMGNYKYVIDDNKAELERKANVKQLVELLQAIGQDPEVNQRLKKIEMAVRVIRDLGYEDAPAMFMSDDEMVHKMLREAGMAEQVAIIQGQMQQNVRRQALMEAGIDPDAAPIQAGNPADPQAAGQAQANPGDGANPGMANVSAGNPGIPSNAA